MSKNKAAPRVSPLFSQTFQKRLKNLRQGAGLTQNDIATALHIAVDTYKKYENRPKSMLPHKYIQAFIEAVGIGPQGYYYLFTGRMEAHNDTRDPPKRVRQRQ